MRIIQIAATISTREQVAELFALTDNGSIYARNAQSGEWERIAGPEAV